MSVPPKARARRVLDEATVIEFLTRSGLVRDDAAGRISVTDMTSRNRNFAVSVSGGGGFFVKQAAFTRDQSALAREHQAYAYLAAAAPAGPRVPRVRHYDQFAGVLVLDLLRGYRTLRRAGRLTPRLGAALGRSLAAFHRLEPPESLERRPRVLTADRPSLADLREVSPATLELTRTLQHDRGLRSGLGLLRDLWQPVAFVHGDVRWDNVLAPQDTSGEVYLVDLEASGFGDPRADLGAVLGEHVWSWLDSMQLRGRFSRGWAASSARLPFDEIRSSVHLFLHAYRHCSSSPTWDVADVTGFAAARLIEGAFERLSEASAADARTLLAVQVAANIFADPEAAACDLFGLRIDRP